MNCKTGLSIFGCLLSLFLMIGSVSAQTVSISPNPVNSPANGQNFTVALNISGGRNVAGYQATINFDSSTLKYVSSTNGAYLPSGAFVVPAITDASSVTAAALALNGSSNGSGTLATVTFRVVSVKASTLRFSGVTLTDPEGRASSPSVVNAQVVPVNICKGDVNGDSVVNVADLALVASRFGQTDGGAADVNADGVVNVVDLALVASEFGESCASPSTASTPSTSANNTVAQTFEQNLLPILSAKCAYAGCHIAGGPKNLDFRTYQTFINGGDEGPIFIPGNAQGSIIIDEIVSGRMPIGGPQLSNAEIQSFTDWINNQEATAVTPVDKSPQPQTPESTDGTVSFQQHLQPILTARCAYSGCHDANDPDGLDFRTYQTFITSAEREDVFVPGNARSSDIIEEIVSGRMPPGGPPLTAAQIQLFRDWINRQDRADFPNLHYDDDDYDDDDYDDDDYDDDDYDDDDYDDDDDDDD